MTAKEILRQIRELRMRLVEVEHDIERVDARIQEIAMLGVSKSEDEPHKAFSAKRKMLAERMHLKREIEELEMEIKLNDFSK